MTYYYRSRTTYAHDSRLISPRTRISTEDGKESTLASADCDDDDGYDDEGDDDNDNNGS